MRGTTFRWGVFGLGTCVALWLSGCGYNALQTKDEQVKSAWSEVLNQYQRRADLIPNLVNTVKGYAAQEQTVLLGVTEARAKAGSIQASADMINDPQALAKFQAARVLLQHLNAPAKSGRKSQCALVVKPAVVEIVSRHAWRDAREAVGLFGGGE